MSAFNKSVLGFALLGRIAQGGGDFMPRVRGRLSPSAKTFLDLLTSVAQAREDNPDKVDKLIAELAKENDKAIREIVKQSIIVIGEGLTDADMAQAETYLLAELYGNQH